jgi:DNA segregation ATPase FtsK/SpoIIIE-like protein
MMRAIARCLLVLALFAAAPALAARDPPARVGRVSLIEGTLAYYGPGDAEWSAAKVNLPAATGGWFATDPQSRAQLRAGANSLNLANDSQLNIVDLAENFVQLALAQGRIDLNLRRAAWRKNEVVEVDMARGGVWLLEPGTYKVEAGGADQPTRVVVFEGSARFAGGGLDRVVKAGEALLLTGADTLTATVEPAAPDEFTNWCRQHDYREQRVVKARHVSPGMTGFEELEEHGSWRTVSGYGPVWFPQAVQPDWTPYRHGSWVWVEPWGWNWVDDEPWGFAPSHYGRWAQVDERWGWVPGEFVSEPVYAPALVAYLPPPAIEAAVPFDAGPPVGWFPLAPGEIYWPAYTRDPTYIRDVNITNVNVARITQVTRAMLAQPGIADPPPSVREQRFANRLAATVVPAPVVVTSAPVAPAAMWIRPEALRQARATVAPPPVVVPPASVLADPGGRSRRDVAAARGAPRAIGAPAPPAPLTSPPAQEAAPRGRPERPNFAGLAPAPRAHHFAALVQKRELAASPAAQAGPQPGAPAPVANVPLGRPEQRPPVAAAPVPAPATVQGQPPNRPDFSRMGQDRRDRGEAAQPPPAQIGPPGTTAGAPAVQPAPRAATPGPKHGPPGPPDFSNLAPARRGHQAAQGAASAPQPGPGAPPGAPQAQVAPPSVPPGPGAPPADRRALQQQAKQRAEAEAAARRQAQQQAAEEAARQQGQHAPGRAPADEAARQQAQQKAAAEAAQRQQAEAAHQAQQKAAGEAAKRQQAEAARQAQQKAAGEAAQRQQAEAARQAQQKAAGEAAQRQQAEAARQTQQKAAAEAAQRQAAQQAQQRAATEAAQRQAAQQAQQRAAAEAAQRQAAQQAQQRAASDASARQQAEAAKAAKGKQAHACGDPGLPPCPR